MALRGAIPVRFEVVFPYGAYLASEVSPVMEFVDGKPTSQKRHEESGDLLWEVAVIDGDPSVKIADKTIKVKIAAKYQPVPPDPMPGSPFTPVEFTDMSAKAYVSTSSSGFSRVAWSLSAREMVSTAGAAA